MIQTEEETLNDILELTKENNRILRGMRRSMIWGQVFTFLYWLAILGVLGWSYYLVQPYIVKYLEQYQRLVHAVGGINGATTALPDLQGLLDKVK
jgi:hypothetical protein